MDNLKCPQVLRKSEELVISGISGKFPECENIQEFSEKLYSGVDMVTGSEKRIPLKYYDLPPRMGLLKDLSKFDAAFFGVHTKQADVTDPAIRILQELTYEAIVDAGVNPEELRGSNTAVIVGCSASESGDFWTQNYEQSGDRYNRYVLIGHAMNMFANRISYAFDFNGPSLTLDTGCSASLAALYTAVNLLRSGQCDSAIVAGANLCLSAMRSVQYNIIEVLSPNGINNIFDAKGDGYVRSEAICAVFIQKKSVARREYCTIVHIGSNCDGYTAEGITFPKQEAQVQLMERIYSESKVDPSSVEYVEAHATGTEAGDPEEINGITKVFCRTKRSVLLAGSVKSNMGHSEATAGLSSLTKIIIAMENGKIPPNLHYKTPNKKIPALLDGRIKVVDKTLPYKKGFVAMNSFGFGGVNVHLLLKPNLKDKSTFQKFAVPHLIVVSGRTEDGVNNFLQKIKQANDDELYSLIRKIHCQNIPRHFYRGYCVLTENESQKVVSEFSGEKPPIWFVFSGLGPQWLGMGKDLMRLEVFHRSIQNSANILKQFGLDLTDIVCKDEENSQDTLTKVNVGVTAIQVALVDLLHSLDIYPDGIIGTSTGEMAAGYADGATTAEQTILIAYNKGKSFTDAKLSNGAMAAVGLSWAEAKALMPPDVFVVCDNCATNVSVSGPADSVKNLVETLKAEGIFAKEINTMGGAFHSKYVSDSSVLFRKGIEKIIPNPKKRSPRWISTSVREPQWKSDLAKYCSVDYHVNNLESPVYLREALVHIPSNAVVIEIGPHCLLQAILKSELPSTCINIGLIDKRHYSPVECFLSNVGKMFNAGLQPKIEALYPEIQYPVSRGTPMISSMIEWDHSHSWAIKSFKEVNQSLSTYTELVNLNDERSKFLEGHNIDGRVLFPAAGYLVLAWKCIAKLHFVKFEDIPVEICDFKIHRTTILHQDSVVKFHIDFLKYTGEFNIHETGSLVASGKIRILDNPESNMVTLLKPYENNVIHHSTEDIYKYFKICGYEYSVLFQGIRKSDVKGISGELEWKRNWITFIDALIQFDTWTKIPSGMLLLPTGVRKIQINPFLHQKLKDGQNISIQTDKNFGGIKSGGIEIHGLECVLTPRAVDIGPSPILETYSYFPYINSKSNSLLIDSLTYNDSLAVSLQIIMENSENIHSLNFLEMIDLAHRENSLFKDISEIFSTEPIGYAKITVAGETKSLQEELPEDVKYIEKSSITKEYLKPINTLVVTNILNKNMFEDSFLDIARQLSPGTFILIHSMHPVDIHTIECDFVLISYKDYGKGNFILLRKVTDLKESKIIYYTEKNFNWLDSLKVAMKECENSDKYRIILVSEGECQSGIIGMINCLKFEPGGHSIRCLFIQDPNAPKFSLHDSFYEEQMNKDLAVNVYKEGVWGSYRLTLLNEVTSKAVEHAYINPATPGDLSSLRWRQGPAISDPNKCYVYYAPLNFRDCMIASGRLKLYGTSGGNLSKDSTLGLEFCGRDRNGKRIMSIVNGCGLATIAIADPITTWNVPDDWTMEEAATVPCVYSTAYYALIMRGQIKRGQSILIHAGCGGVGLAAITLSLHIGATVYTTVGSQEKRDFLKKRFSQLTDRNIASSRDTSFEQHVMRETAGRGVDLVLNSLSEEKLQASVRCLAKNGKFLEIGKYDIFNNNPLGMSTFLKNTSFCGILLDSVLNSDSETKQEVAELVRQGLESGVVKPLPTTVYQANQAEEAFRFLSSGKHIGKVILKLRDEEPLKIAKPREQQIQASPKVYFNSEKVYIIIGGLGGLGLELANWLCVRGVKNLVLTSRSGVKEGYQRLCLTKFEMNNINVTVSTIDCKNESEAVRLIEESMKWGPIGGIFNLAAVIAVDLYQYQTEHNFKICYAPKANVTKHLDKVSRIMCPGLDYFVVFSSVSSGKGNPGASCYGLANSVMDIICEARHEAGFPALAIQWGPIGVSGLYDQLRGETGMRGMYPQKLSSFFKTLDMFLTQTSPIVSSYVVEEKVLLNKNSVQKLGPADVVAKIVGLKNINDENPALTLAQIGADSLMVEEIKQTLERNFDIVINVEDIRQLTLSQIKNLKATER